MNPQIDTSVQMVRNFSGKRIHEQSRKKLEIHREESKQEGEGNI